MATPDDTMPQFYLAQSSLAPRNSGTLVHCILMTKVFRPKELMENKEILIFLPMRESFIYLSFAGVGEIGVMRVGVGGM